MNHRLPLLLVFFALASCDRPERISPSWGDPIVIDPAIPPNGMHLVQILLENQMLPVKGTGCESSAKVKGFVDKRLLQHSIAMMLGSSIEPGTLEFQISGGCAADQLETEKGPFIDIWRCHLATSNIDTGKVNVMVSAHIFFGITRDTWKFLPEKLQCQ